MERLVVGRADRSKTVDEAMAERHRTGAQYMDLATGELVNIVPDKAPEPEKVAEPAPAKKKVPMK